MCCQDDVAPKELLLIHAACQFLDVAFQLMYVYEQLMIVELSCGMVATLGMGAGPIKALVEAEVSYDGFTVSRGGIATPLIIARPLGVSLLLDDYKTCIRPIFEGKNVLLTLVVYIDIICGYQTSHHQVIWPKKPCQEKSCIAWLMLYTSVIKL
jgi:hypothetical protein